jgi:tetratricopeptide (TPR) repeat protein
MLAFLFAVQFQELYDAGKFEEALTTLSSQPAETAAYFYNVGTLNYRLGHLGKAVAYLEKASRLNGNDPDIEANLGLARASLGRTLGNDRLDPAATSLESAVEALPTGLVELGAGVTALALSILWLTGYRRTRSARQTFLQPLALAGLACLIVLGGGLLLKRTTVLPQVAATLESQTIRSGPGDRFLEIGRVEAGVKLRLLGPTAKAAQNETWNQVRYSREGIGWVRASTLLLL